MHKLTSTLMLAVFALVATVFTVSAQVPTGIISGTVTDESGAVIPNVPVTITSKDTGLSRVLNTDTAGPQLLPALPAGAGMLCVEIEGFLPLALAGNHDAGAPAPVHTLAVVWR